MDDVAIAGAGPAGSFAAILLARAGLRVTLFDRARFPRPKLCGDTLNPGACRVLARHLPIAPLIDHARALDGMLLTGPGRVSVRGRYGAGVRGYAIERTTLDQWLLDQAVASGARVEENCEIDGAIVSNECVTGVRMRDRGCVVAHAARMIIAADGRRSRLAFSLGLTTHPRRPRRWAIGAYFADVADLADCGEMHVRPGHYIGVAPMPGGVANTCLVVPHHSRRDGWRDSRALLVSRLAADPRLGPRFARARMTRAPAVLGPMAVEARAAGTTGLLLAGDAAGFVDPMTGDGLTFALSGAELAAQATLDVFSGRIAPTDAPRVLHQRRRRVFRRKWRFNRTLRRLVASPTAITGAAAAARLLPAVFEAMIRYAGDVRKD